MRTRQGLLLISFAVAWYAAMPVLSEPLQLPSGHVHGPAGPNTGIGGSSNASVPSGQHVPIAVPHVPIAVPHVPMAMPAIPVNLPQVPTALPHLPTTMPQFPMNAPHTNMNVPHSSLPPVNMNASAPQIIPTAAPGTPQFVLPTRLATAPGLPFTLGSGSIVTVERGAKVLVGENDRLFRLQNLTGTGKSVRVEVIDAKGNRSEITLDPGTELVAAKDRLSDEDVRPADGIARRNISVVGNIGVSEIDLGSVLKQNGSLARLITNPLTKAEKKAGAAILKTAAALLTMRGTHGFRLRPTRRSFASTNAAVNEQVSDGVPPAVPNQIASDPVATPSPPIAAVSNSPAASPPVLTEQTKALVVNNVAGIADRTVRYAPTRTNGTAPRERKNGSDRARQSNAEQATTLSAPLPSAKTKHSGSPASQKLIAVLPSSVRSLTTKNANSVNDIAEQAMQEVKAHPKIALALILLFCVMFASMTMLAATARRRAVELQKANAMLNTQIDERMSAEQEVARLNRGLHAKIAELNELNEELMKTRDKALEASRLKSEFVANISHEIRTPITAVLGMIGLLRETSTDADQGELVGMLDESARSLLNIINDILDFSKIEAGMLLIQAVDFEIRGVVKETTDVLAAGAAQKGLQVKVQIDDSVPGIVRGDPFRLRQVLLNLLGNAIKFSSEGTVSITVNSPADAGENVVGFYVKDSGIGIPENARHRLFQPFSQADGRTTRLFGGTGLGLSISKRLVDLMGGQIDFKSEEGKGSEFWFQLPFEAAQTTPALAAKSAASVGTTRPGHAGAKRILVAEDSPVLQRIVKHHLQNMHCEVVMASNGLEAVEAIKNGNFDLILMDWQMPQLDGIQATQEIRALTQGSNIPIIAMTANAMEGDRLSCLNAGMNDYISKPFTVEQLQKTVDAWLPHDTTSGATES